MRYCFIALLCILVPSLSWGLACRTQTAGSWASVETWSSCQGRVPTSGDSVTISHAVAVSGNVTVGTSPPNETFIDVLVTSGGRIELLEDAVLTVSGNLKTDAGSLSNNQVGLRLNPGSQLLFDATARQYKWEVGRWNSIHAHGTSAKRAVFSSLSSAAGTRAHLTTTYTNYGACLDWEYVDFRRFGSRSVAAIPGAHSYSTNCPDMSVKNSLFSGNGTIVFSADTAGTRWLIENNRFIGSVSNLAAGVSALQFLGYDEASPDRVIRLNYFDDGVLFGASSVGHMGGWSVTKNFFNKGAGTSPKEQGVGENRGFYQFDHNYVNMAKVLVNLEGDISNNYFIQDDDQGGGTLVTTHASSADRTLSGNVFDYTGPGYGGDWIVPTSNNGYAVTIERNICLPQKQFRSGGAFVSTWMIPVNPNTILEVNGNTYVTTGVDETGLAVGHAYTGFTPHTNSVVNSIRSFRNNLAWTPPGKEGGYKFVRQASLMQDILYAENADYNWGWNLADGSDGKGYNAWTAYRSTPIFSENNGIAEVHSDALTGDPQFMDWRRSMPSFDRDGLGNTSDIPAWQSGITYDVGDIVYTSHPDNYEGTPINYRCIAAHTASPSNQPGIGRSVVPSGPGPWRGYWEYATVYRIRTDIALVDALIDWVKSGFTTENALLATGGENGNSIGAVTPATDRTPPAVTLTVEPPAAGSRLVTFSLSAADNLADGMASSPAGYLVIGSDLEGFCSTAVVDGLAFSLTPPSSYRFSGVSSGTRYLCAVARDINDNYARQEQAVTLTDPAAVTPVNVPPTVVLTTPAAGALFTAPAAITLTAAAADSDGTVSRVDFYNGATLLGSATSTPYRYTWSPVSAGTSTLTAVATDDSGATVTSAAATVTVAAPAVRTNVALAANGGIATASSGVSATIYPASAANNGDRTGKSWGSASAQGGWADATPGAYPDWVEIAFNGQNTINEIGVVTLQDRYALGTLPTETQTFTRFGLTSYDVQYWDGKGWVTVGSAAGSNLVWRRFTFSPVTTDRIRVNVTGTKDGRCRIVEIEAYSVGTL